MFLPRAKIRFALLDVEMRVEDRVVGDMPEPVLVIGAQPKIIRTDLNGFSKHRERRLVLADQQTRKV